MSFETPLLAIFHGISNVKRGEILGLFRLHGHRLRLILKFKELYNDAGGNINSHFMEACNTPGKSFLMVLENVQIFGPKFSR